MIKQRYLIASIFIMTIPLGAQAANFDVSQICNLAVRAGEQTKKLSKSEEKKLVKCEEEGKKGFSRCQSNFIKITKGLNFQSKSSILRLLNGTRNVATCTSDLLIKTVVKYYPDKKK